MSNCPWTNLWAAVLSNALIEGLTAAHEIARTGTMHVDCAYFLERRPGFVTVCHMVGIEPEFVRDHFLDTLEDKQLLEAVLAALPASHPDRQGRPIRSFRKRIQPPPAAPRPKRKRKPRTGKGEPKRYEMKGQSLTIRELATLYGVNGETIRDRLRKGWSIEEAVLTPTRSTPTPGVVSNLAPLLGTGGGTAAQDSPEIDFSESLADETQGLSGKSSSKSSQTSNGGGGAPDALRRSNSRDSGQPQVRVFPGQAHPSQITPSAIASDHSPIDPTLLMSELRALHAP